MGLRDLEKRLAELSNSERLSLLNETLEHFEKSGNNEAVCDVLFLMGTEYISKGEFSKGSEIYVKSADLCKSSGNLNGEAISYNNLGFINKVMGDQKSALNFYDKALNIYRKAGSKHRESLMLSNIGKLYFDRGEYLEAIECFEDAIELSGESTDLQSNANMLVALGNSYVKANDLSRALEAYNKSLEERKKLGDKKGVSASLKLAAGVFLLLGEERKAEQILMENAALMWTPPEGTIGKEFPLDAQDSVINLTEITAAIFEEIKNKAYENNIKLFSREESTAIPVIADKVIAGELLNSLLLLAIDRTPPGESVYLYTGLHNGKARCEIIDEGPDMSADETSSDPKINEIRNKALTTGYVLSHEKMMGKGNSFILEFKRN